MRFQPIVVTLLCAAACGHGVGNLEAGDASDAGDGGSVTLQDGGTSDAGEDAGPADAGEDAGTSDAGTDGGSSSGANIRVHYPVGSGHTLTIRGGSTPLNWTAGQALVAGASNTWTYSLEGLSGEIEYKPLLDDSTWARGPNYHVGPGETVDIYPHFNQTTGQVATLFADFHSTVLDNDRAVYIYYPASYAENTVATYPVVYMHDGQNLWAALPQLAFATTWNVDTAFDTAAENGTCSGNGEIGWSAQPLGGTPTTCTGDADCASGSCRTFPEAIVIAPANTAQRIYEYTPTPDQEPAGTTPTPGGGGGDLYIEMLINELKPAVETQLAGRVRTGPENTAMAGSSLGGLITAYAGYKRPDIYGLIGAISPSTWWSTDVIVTDVQQTLAAPNRPLRIYVDSGSGDADDESDTDMLSAAYIGLGYQEGVDYHHVVQQGAQHNETYWAERFPGAMQFLLGER